MKLTKAKKIMEDINRYEIDTRIDGSYTRIEMRDASDTISNDFNKRMTKNSKSGAAVFDAMLQAHLQTR